jgi:hypothetical protein
MRVHTLALALALLTPTAASAKLIDLHDGTILSTTLGYAFLQDFNTPQTSGYDADGLMWTDQSVAWIDSLNASAYLGYSDWQLAGYQGSRTYGPTGDGHYRQIRTLEYLLEVEAGLPSSDAIPYDAVSGGPSLLLHADTRRDRLRSRTLGPFTNVQSHYQVWDSNRQFEVCQPFCNPLFYDLVYDDYDQLAWAYATAMRPVAAPTPTSVPTAGTLPLLALGCVLACVYAKR